MPLEFFKEATFKEYERYFNVYKLNIASKDRKVDDERNDYDTALGGWVKNGEPGLQAVKVTAYYAQLPFPVHLAWAVLNGSSSASIGMTRIVVTFIAFGALAHETGHALCGLRDEYPKGQNAPVERVYNVADTSDPKKVPWAHWLADPKLAQLIGIGIYQRGGDKGFWRPTDGKCCMAAASMNFCPVCREQIVLTIYTLVNPVDERAPNNKPIRLQVVKGAPGEKIPYQLVKTKNPPCWIIPLQPATHSLQVKWYLQKISSQEVEKWLKPNESLDETNPAIPTARHYADIKLTGDELPGLKYRDAAKRQGEYPDLSKSSLAPGHYVLIAQVKDEPVSLINNVRVPWVLKEKAPAELGGQEEPLLEERIAWVLEISEEGSNK